MAESLKLNRAPQKSKVLNFWHYLTKPSNKITDPILYRRMQFLASTVIIFFAFFGTLDLSLYINDPSYRISTPLIIGYSILALVYFLNRFNRFHIASYIISLSFTLVLTAAVVNEAYGFPEISLTYFVIGLFISSLLLTTSATIFICAINILIIILLTLVTDLFDIDGGLFLYTVGLNIICTVLIVLTTNLRNREEAESNQQLLATNHLLKSIQAVSKTGTWENELETGKVQWNEQAYAIFERDEELGPFGIENLLNILHPNDRDKFSEMRQTVLQTKNPVETVLRVQISQSQLKYLSTRLFAYEYEPQKIKIIGSVQDITRQKKAEENLEYQAILLHSITNAIITTDLNFNVQSWNSAAEELYGWKESEAFGKSMGELIPTTYSNVKREHFLTSFQEQGIWKGEVVQKHKDGHDIHILSSVNLVRDKHGNPISIIVINIDISERKEAELALRKSEEFFRTLFEYSPLGINISTHDGQSLHVNQKLQELLGYSKSELMNLKFIEITHKDSIDISIENLNRMVSGDSGWVDFEKKYIRKNGEPFWARFIGSKIHTDNEDNHLLIGMIDDIDEKKQFEAERMSKHRQLAILNEITLTTLRDSSFTALIRFISSRLADLLHADEAAIFLEGEEPDTAVYHQSDNPTYFDRGFKEIYREVIKTSNHLFINDLKNWPNLFCQNIDYSPIASILSLPLKADGEKLGVIILTYHTPHILSQSEIDIGEQAAAQCSLAIAKAKLIVQVQQQTVELEKRVSERTLELHKRVEEVEMLNQGMLNLMQDLKSTNFLLKTTSSHLSAANSELESFSYSVSHDLRAPLRHINGFVKLLQQREYQNLDKTSQRYLDNITRSAQRMSNLIDDLLAFSRMGRTEIRPNHVQLNPLIQTIRNELQPEYLNRELAWEIQQLPTVKGDRNLLKQVFANLISNALKYSAPKAKGIIEIGSISLTTQLQKSNLGKELWEGLDLSHSEEPFEIFYVKDNGVGFDSNYKHKLFGVFQRLHHQDEFEGTGIGLATVKRIINHHNGSVYATSELGAGATFYLTLPTPQE